MGMVPGTPLTCPEQARGLAVDRRADIWSFGACLFESLTGERAFQSDDAAGLSPRSSKASPVGQSCLARLRLLRISCDGA